MLSSLELFSGYGGISYGLREYTKPMAYCEIDRYARSILASRISDGLLPFAPIFPDVRKLRGTVGCADIIVGGFPCQDISVAGHGIGLEGERSGLFFEVVRLTKEINPTFVFLENVPAIRTRGLRQVIGAFTEMGYDCRWTCLSASSVGAPHKRERWFLLAHTHSTKLWEQPRWCEGQNGKSKDELKYFSKEKSSSNADRKNVERQWQVSERRKTKHTTISIPSGWTTEPPVCGVDDGTTFRVDRIKALGNGVVPLQVKTAFEKLMGWL